MKSRAVSWLRTLLVAGLIGAVVGMFDIPNPFSTTVHAQLSCNYPPPPGCSLNGCRPSYPGKDPFWVCNFIGENCPPLEQCE